MAVTVFSCVYVYISDIRRLIFEVSRSRTETRPIGRTPPNQWSTRRRGRYLHKTQQTNERDETNIHALSGIRTHDPNNQGPKTHALFRMATGIVTLIMQIFYIRVSDLRNWGAVSLLGIVASWSKVWVCGCSLAAIASSNPAGGMDVCCVVSGRGFCSGLITRPEESYRLWCVWV
jgi:hypothetical protein